MSSHEDKGRHSNVSSDATEIEVRRRVKEMRDEELVDFIRETVTHLEILAERLDSFVDSQVGEVSGDAG